MSTEELGDLIRAVIGVVFGVGGLFLAAGIALLFCQICHDAWRNR